MADVGLREVAARAGVSISTVSNALNRPDLVSKRAAERVTQAIDELGYVPNTAARQLRAGRSNAIGMTVINITNPFFANVVIGAEETAERAGYTVLVGHSFDSVERERRHLDLLDRQRVDGVLFAPVTHPGTVLQRFSRRGTPVVFIDRRDEDGVFPSVSMDDVAGGRLVAEHLLAGGAQHLTFLGGPFERMQILERFTGFREVAEAAGKRVSVIEVDTLNPRLGRELGERILQMPAADRPDAVFCGNDELAVGVLQTMIASGVRVPDEIAIVGYDDIEYAAAAAVPLTSIRQPAYEMGSRAAELLISLLTGATEVESVVFQPELIVRSSTHAVG